MHKAVRVRLNPDVPTVRIQHASDLLQYMIQFPNLMQHTRAEDNIETGRSEWERKTVSCNKRQIRCRTRPPSGKHPVDEQLAGDYLTRLE